MASGTTLPTFVVMQWLVHASGVMAVLALGTTVAIRADAAPPESPHYRVEIIHGAVQSSPTPVYFAPAQKPDSNLQEDLSWASFALGTTTTVRVTNLRTSFTRCRILPSHRGIAPRVDGTSIEFDLDQPGQFAVEFDEGTDHPLLVFADPPETEIPDRNAPGVLWFGPGLHDLGEQFIEPKAGQTVYFAPGAYVRARIRAAGAPGVRIIGRGVLTGEHLPANPPNTYTTPHLLDLDAGCTGALIEGISLVNSPHYNILARGADSVVRNVKMMGWWFGTDGIGIGDRGLIEDCFLKCNDDAIKVYPPGLVVRRCTIWQMENGAPFQLSWNLNVHHAGFHISDCDIIRVDHHQGANNRAIFNAIHGGSGHLSDYLFEDIRIENARYRFLLLQIKKTNWSKAKEWGSISNIILRNISTDGPFSQRSAIRSDDPAGRIDGVLFDNVHIGGRLITSAAEAHVDIDPATTSGIRFEGRPVRKTAP